MNAQLRKHVNKRSAFKLAVTHTPCMTLAIVGGVLLPGLLPDGILHNLMLEVPIVLLGAILGDYYGHRLFDTYCEKKGFANFIRDFRRPAQLLKAFFYTVISLFIHVLIFQGAHLSH